MADDLPARPRAPQVFTIPPHRSFADALAAGLIARTRGDPLVLAAGRILLPNNRAKRTLNEAFVRASGSGLLLPRLIPIGDPELDDRIGGALDPAGDPDPVPPAVDPLERLLVLAELVRGDETSAAEALRLAADLARTLDAVLIEEVEPGRLADAAANASELAGHWQVSLDRLRAILDLWPRRLGEMGRIDLADRRNRLLRRLAERWRDAPPPGFTVAAGITTAAPAVARLLRRVADLPDGLVVLPGISLADVMPDAEWDALGPDDAGRADETHPQFHLKQLLDRMGVARGEVMRWRAGGRGGAPAVRGRAVAHAMTAADFSDKWSALKPIERRLGGVRAAELADPAAEAQTIALALREAIETPGLTAALVTPDRLLATRVSALLQRWGIAADDSAGQALSQTAAGTLLLAIAAAAAEDFAPVPLLALLKHPLVGGEDEQRRIWLDAVRLLDLALRGPRPAAGLAGLDAHFAAKGDERQYRGCLAAWQRVRSSIAGIGARPVTLAGFAQHLAASASAVAGERAWRGADGRMTADLLLELQDKPAAALPVASADQVPMLRQLLERHSVRPPYGGHPRVFIWGLLEARLQQADLMVLGGLNEGVWPALPAPDPWLAPRIRANLKLPGLDFRTGLAAHDFASALGARQVLITRARRDNRAPTVASRLWLRLRAMTGGLARDIRLERLALALDDPGVPQPAHRPRPAPPATVRPKRISVTAVDRLKADPFAFYAQAMLGLRSLDPIDAEHSAAWKGSAVHEVLERWLAEDNCDPTKLLPRARALLSDGSIHPMLRALWQPRLDEAIKWVVGQETANQAVGRLPLAAEAQGETVIDGVTVHGKADRLDRLANGGLAIVDYKTGKAPRQKAVDEGFALQLGLLGLIARASGFADKGEPHAHEYWSLTKHGDSFGKCSSPDLGDAAGFLAHAQAQFEEAARKWLTGDEPFTAKLNPAYAPYGDYDQLMRLEEWYGRE
ncbi:double-strand break repair protein AddB [Sphingomonas sp.]|uniref:double-strand break repair protein AddB n=1 Tax=Sphingomonas sp. TaxID=28214 RepID=UPI00286EA1B1|nr:double-strand break repair protein AddB [Sphingomonas sp.]